MPSSRLRGARVVAEDLRAERAAVDLAVGADDVLPEGVNDVIVTAAALSVRLVADLVRIDDDGALASEVLADDGLPAGDAAGEPDHDRHVDCSGEANAPDSASGAAGSMGDGGGPDKLGGEKWRREGAGSEMRADVWRVRVRRGTVRRAVRMAELLTY